MKNRVGRSTGPTKRGLFVTAAAGAALLSIAAAATGSTKGRSAGFVAGHVVSPNKELGAAYDEATKALVFNPLGMTDTTFDFGRALRADHATPYDDSALLAADPIM